MFSHFSWKEVGLLAYKTGKKLMLTSLVSDQRLTMTMIY